MLVDLRNHGKSRDASPPHTVEACAGDILNLSRVLDKEVNIVWGHSFGGKVATALGMCAPVGLEEIWVLDTSPSESLVEARAQVRDVVGLIETLAQIELPLESRDELVRALRSRGISDAVSQWMTTNLRATAEGGYDFAFSLTGVRAMLDSYVRHTLWDDLSRLEARYRVHVVHGQHSDRWRHGALERLHGMAAVGGLQVHQLAGAGHWLHVDNPDGLMSLLCDGLEMDRVARKR